MSTSKSMKSMLSKMKNAKTPDNKEKLMSFLTGYHGIIFTKRLKNLASAVPRFLESL